MASFALVSKYGMLFFDSHQFWALRVGTWTEEEMVEVEEEVVEEEAHVYHCLRVRLKLPINILTSCRTQRKLECIHSGINGQT